MIYRDLLDEAELSTYAGAMNARAKSLDVPGRVSVPLLRDRILESAGRCEWCGESVVGLLFEIDHVLSLSKGGMNTPQNLVVACPSCNRRKAEKHPATFAQEIVAAGTAPTSFVRSLLETFGIAPTRQQSLFDDPL